MKEPDWINDNKVWVWNNALAIGFNALFFLIFPAGLINGFVRNPTNYALLIAGIILFYVIYEWGLFSYIRVTYHKGELEFKKPLRKYSILFRKKDYKMLISPDEWTEVYRYWVKGGTAYYFRNNGTDAYFVSAEGLTFLYKDLVNLFSHGVKQMSGYPTEVKRRMRREGTGRVF